MQFKKSLLDGLKGEEYDFGDVVVKGRAKWENKFKETAKEAVVEGTDWVWEDEMELLREEIQGVADQCRKDETKKMVNQIEVCFLQRIIWLQRINQRHRGTSRSI